MKIETEFTSGNPESSYKKQKSVLTYFPVQKEPQKINLRLDPELENQFGNQSVILAQGLEQNLSSDKVQEFLNILKSDLPNEFKSYFENLTAKEIANIIALVVMSVALIATGVGIVPATALIGARLGIQSIFIRAITTGLTRPNVTSAIMGAIPGMKNFAPNQSLALAVNTMKDVIFYILPGLAVNATAKNKDESKK